MSGSVIQFIAATVECVEAIDWEIVQVNFDTMDSSFDEEGRTSPYVMISANFEFSNRIQVEFHDGSDYARGWLGRVELWRNRVFMLSKDGHEFDITFDLSDEAFAELREYLKILLRDDCFRQK